MGLIRTEVAAELAGMKWSESHGADGGYLGAGLAYYMVAYVLRAATCVCLGSGGGFVPAMMAQAHRDLEESGNAVSRARVVLVDGDVGPWGRPDWLEEGSAFRKAWPEVEVVVSTTAEAARRFALEGLEIDYLHVDADHSEAGCLVDLRAWFPMLGMGAYATLHDTSPRRRLEVSPAPGVLDAFEKFSREWKVESVDFPFAGAGTRLVRNLMRKA